MDFKNWVPVLQSFSKEILISEAEVEGLHMRWGEGYLKILFAISAEHFM
jgi:hypothetical protein